MDPLVTSSLISAGSGLLGGMMGGGQKRPSYEPYMKALVGNEATRKKLGISNLAGAQAYADGVAFDAKMAAAKKHNIHPLSMLGVSFGGSSQPSAYIGESGGSRVGDAISEVGQGVSRAVAAWSSREEREMAKASAKLSLENQELQNARLRSEIQLMHGVGSPPGHSYLADNGQDARYPAQAYMPMGYGDTAPLLRVGRDAKGNPIRVYNDDLGDNEVLQAATAFGYSIPDWLHGNITKPAGRALAKFFRAMKASGREYGQFRK